MGYANNKWDLVDLVHFLDWLESTSAGEVSGLMAWHSTSQIAPDKSRLSGGSEQREGWHVVVVVVQWSVTTDCYHSNGRLRITWRATLDSCVRPHV